MPEFSVPDFLPWRLAVSALFGLLLGSFLNVCIFRVVRDLSVVAPRSFCPHCQEPIGWRDNIPVLSYVLLRGRCRRCGVEISARYPLVEVAAAGLFMAVAWRYGWTLAGLKWALFESLAVVLFCTDLEVQLLPDEFTLGGLVAGAVLAWFVPIHSAFADLFLRGWPVEARSLLLAGVGAAFLALPLWIFAAFYKRLRGLATDPLGLGDVKLMALIGVFFGLEKAVPVFIVASVLGAVTGGIFLLVKGRTAWRLELPFGTFLCGVAAFAGLLG